MRRPHQGWRSAIVRRRRVARPSRMPPLRRKLEAIEFERRRDRAADEGPGTKRTRGLPLEWLDDELRTLTGAQVGPQDPPPSRLSFDAGLELERCAGVEVPDLGGVDAMPMRTLASLEQEVNRRSGATRIASIVPPSFDVVATFGMRAKPERLDDVGGSHTASVGPVRGGCQLGVSTTRGGSSVAPMPSSEPFPLDRAMVASQRMIRWNLDQDQLETIGVGRAQLDQSPGLFDSRLENGSASGAELLFRARDVTNLEPELGCW